MERIFIFWTENNPLTANRIRAIGNMKMVSGVEIILVHPGNLDTWIVQGYPLHESYPYLSAVHKADYLRCYFMHHHGGGYSDIKSQSHSWKESFEKLQANQEMLAIGYQELEGGVATVDDKNLYQEMCQNYKQLIGNGAYICKPHTELTTEWYQQLHFLLDAKLYILRANPASHVRDHTGLWLGDHHSTYPLRWTEILGCIFHPLVYKYRDRISKELPTPIFNDYQ